ncbi:MAG TPA: acyl-CoA dehydrogenase family protein, partial [Syntrophomonas sp.]|nr:acyl-CoA dehydrogenase family protein [Syntrophomonas sp.]
ECERQHRYPIEYKKTLVDNGFSFLGIPEEYGGSPCDIMTLILVAETCAACGGPYYLWGEAIQIDDILTFGNEEQKKVVMEAASKGLQPFSLGFTEPGAGSDSTAITTTATRKDGKVYINGQKTLISYLDNSPYTLVLTRDLENPNPHKAVSMWLVPNDAPGITINNLNKIGWHMTTTSEMFFDHVEVEETALVGKEGNGFMQLMKNFEIERILACAVILGACQAAYDDTVYYANQREQFGQTIGSFQLIQQKITDMAIALENMRNMIYKCAWMKDQGMDLKVQSALCKRYVGEAGWWLVDEALQIHGGLGYTDETRISRLWRDLRVGRIGGGTSEVMVHIAGKALLKGQK